MALWGNTDALASAPKYVARKALFDSTAVDTTAKTINILSSGTGFATGDAVKYSINGGTVITGLVDGTTYTVRVVGAGLIELYDTYDHAINTGATTGRKNLTGAGVGIQILQRTQAANAYGDHVNSGRQIVFVDASEATVAANKAKGITGAGWWAFRTYTDSGSATRVKAECLVAMTVTALAAGDDEDTVVVDRAITISTQPSTQTIAANTDTTLTVVATATGTGPLTYQWQWVDSAHASEDPLPWASVPSGTGANTATYTTMELGLGDSGTLFRCVITATGAAQVISDTAEVFVA